MLQKEAYLPETWKVVPWVFVPSEYQDTIEPHVNHFDPAGQFATMEETLPWKYGNWNGKDSY